MNLSTRPSGLFTVVILVLVLVPRGWTDDGSWIDLTNLDAWKSPVEGWAAVGSVSLDPNDPKKLTSEPGRGVIFNGLAAESKNLISKEVFGDVEMHVEFNVPKGSNSGVKFQAVYEVQIFDSFEVKTLKGSDCGGVYPRSEDKPKYHHIDDGYAPLVNASKAPGEWQVLDLKFIAPRFDPSGQKIASARISAVLNGKVVQDNLEVVCPTGAAWKNKEHPTGPILLQPITVRSPSETSRPAICLPNPETLVAGWRRPTFDPPLTERWWGDKNSAMLRWCRPLSSWSPSRPAPLSHPRSWPGRSSHRASPMGSE